MRNTVRELRTTRGLSQGQLAAALDVSRQTINSIEQERYTPSLPLALALGSGSELLQPLAICVIGGLLFALLLSLVVTPAVFAMIRRR